MVLRPILDVEPEYNAAFIPAWTAVESRQKLRANSWLLITQPEHAALSGELASQIDAPGFPKVGSEVVHAIALHDAGWEQFEADPRAPRVHADGHPLSFLEIPPADFLRAWIGSIDCAEEESQVGGYLVSRHFSSLGEFRLQRNDDPPAVRQQIEAFLQEEKFRQTRLGNSASERSRWDPLLPLLQFCDVLSLYLCSGTLQPVEFPYEFPNGRIRLQCAADGSWTLHPSPFRSAFSVSVKARPYPPVGDEMRIHFSLR
jgi:hypothetical protein